MAKGTVERTVEIDRLYEFTKIEKDEHTKNYVVPANTLCACICGHTWTRYKPSLITARSGIRCPKRGCGSRKVSLKAPGSPEPLSWNEIIGMDKEEEKARLENMAKEKLKGKKKMGTVGEAPTKIQEAGPITFSDDDNKTVDDLHHVAPEPLEVKIGDTGGIPIKTIAPPDTPVKDPATLKSEMEKMFSSSSGLPPPPLGSSQPQGSRETGGLPPSPGGLGTTIEGKPVMPLDERGLKMMAQSLAGVEGGILTTLAMEDCPDDIKESLCNAWFMTLWRFRDYIDQQLWIQAILMAMPHAQAFMWAFKKRKENAKSKDESDEDTPDIPDED